MIVDQINENNLKFVLKCYRGESRHKLTGEEVWSLLGENWSDFISDTIPDNDYDSEPIEFFDNLNLKEMERCFIIRALEQNGWRQKKAADTLGITPRALNYKIQIYKINCEYWSRKND